MVKIKKLSLLLVVPLIISLVACAAQTSTGSGTTTDSSGQNNAQGTPQPNGGPGGTMTLEDKLAMGTLKLEGTSNAITADEAKTLLPLWKAVKSMSSSNTASADELNALYQQIEDSMTAAQVQAIKDLNLSQADQQALMTQYGVEGPQMSGTKPSSTRIASNSQQGGGPGGGGPGGGGGGMPPDGGGAPGGGAQGGNTTTGRTASGTQQAGMPNRPRVGGMNQMFMTPLITLLQTRAGK